MSESRQESQGVLSPTSLQKPGEEEPRDGISWGPSENLVKQQRGYVSGGDKSNVAENYCASDQLFLRNI